MRGRRTVSIYGAGSVLLLAGCSQWGSFIQIGSSDKSSSSKTTTRLVKDGSDFDPLMTYVDVWVDGKLAMNRYGRSVVTDPVSVHPKFKYTINDARAFGKVRSVIINIHREVGGNWYPEPEFIVTSANPSETRTQIRPGKKFDLGSPNSSLLILNREGKPQTKLKLKASSRYLMNFTVHGTLKETVGVEFTTQ